MKSWKQLPYWLRGGVIGGGVTIVSYILTSSCEYLVVVPGYSGLGFECFPFAIPWMPFWFVPSITSLSTINYGITVFAIWFIIGSLIGALWNHIKNTYYTHWPYWLQVTIKIFLLLGIPIIFMLLVSYFMPGKSSRLIDEGKNFTIQ